jgi:hypothetical protein
MNRPSSFWDLCLFIYVDIWFVGGEGGEREGMEEMSEEPK